MSKNCLGSSERDIGQKREPMPPAMMTAKVLGMWAMGVNEGVGQAQTTLGQVGHLPFVALVVVHPVQVKPTKSETTERTRKKFRFMAAKLTLTFGAWVSSSTSGVTRRSCGAC